MFLIPAQCKMRKKKINKNKEDAKVYKKSLVELELN